jgi:tripartite-type tricarboxylate transporter receptor subunit TctC
MNYNDVVKIMKTPDMKPRLEQFGGEPGGLTPDQFAGFVKSEAAKWGKGVRESKATVG